LRLFVCLSILFVCSPQNGFSEESFSESWQSLETKYTAIHYHTVNDLYKFDRMVAYSPGQWGFPSLFKKSDPKDRLEKIGRKVDTLYERVQEILDMRKWFKKVSINLYADKKELDAAYFELYRQPCQIRAWYAYEFNTIYVNVDDTHEEILAHEMAHAIIDHYLLVRPPAAAAEILARYVHTHIYD
jgi:hypothetical protein